MERSRITYCAIIKVKTGSQANRFFKPRTKEPKVCTRSQSFLGLLVAKAKQDEVVAPIVLEAAEAKNEAVIGVRNHARHLMTVVEIRQILTIVEGDKPLSFAGHIRLALFIRESYTLGTREDAFVRSTNL